LLKTLWLGVSIPCVWYLTHPYMGMVHDSVIYVGRALANLHPATIGTQLSYVHDGQSKFSLFPLVMTWAVQALGPGTAALLTTALGLALWLGAATFLFSRLLKGSALAAALLFLCVMPSVYGGDGVFRWAEPFATPRIFAEAGSLLAIGLFLDHKRIAAFFCLGLAALLHPIMALPAIGLVILLLCLEDRRWLAVPALAIAGVAAAVLLHIPLAERLVTFPDPAWMKAIMEVTPFLYPLQWRVSDWSILVCQLVTAGFVVTYCSGTARRLAAAAVLTAASILVAALLPSLLVLQMQIWRTAWLLSVLVIGLLPLLAAALWSRGQAGRLASIFMILAWSQANEPAAALPLLAVAAVLAGGKPGASLPRLISVGGWACAVVLTLYLAVVRAGTFWLVLKVLAPGMGFALPVLLSTGVLFMVCATPGLALSVGWRPQALPGSSFAGPALAVLLVMLALIFWDSRASISRFLETDTGKPPLSTIIESGQVEWLNDRGNSWLVTGHPEWWGHIQGAGVIFDRDLAVEWDRRYHKLLDVGLRAPIDPVRGQTPHASAVVTLGQLWQVCLRGPDWFVALKAQTAPDAVAAATRQWQAPADDYILNDRGDKWIAVRDYVIFNCRDFRP